MFPALPRSSIAAVSVVAACLLAPSVAHADEDGIAPAPGAGVARRASLVTEDGEPRRRWYGWQTLLVDGTTLVTSPVLIGLPGLVVGTPIVHLVHRQYLAAGVSFGIRATGAAAVAYWASTAPRGGDFAGLEVLARIIIGGGLAHAFATAFDAAVLAYDDRPEHRSNDARRSTVRFTPTGGPTANGGLSLGVSGTF
ncbi:MAG: hypothetical protein JST00_38950 [Deltaproteobacteria bacterium]|nr:hypothetical protein [Deltaproteobacteria bacterium]